MPKKAAKKTVKRIPIKPPAGIRRGKTVKRGGLIPLAIAAPLLGALGAPLAGLAGKELAKGAQWGVKKIRKLLGVGVVRAGATRAQGGRKKATRRIVVRV